MESVEPATVLKTIEETKPQAGDQFRKADRAIIGVECCLQSLMKVSIIIRSGLHTGFIAQKFPSVYMLT